MIGMRRPLLLVLGCLIAQACLMVPTSPTLPTAEMSLPETVRIQRMERGEPVVRNVPLDEYVLATAISEFAPPAGDLETVERMLEVQAVISRTYAVAHRARHTSEGFDLCSTTHCQIFEPGRVQTSRWSAAASEAVRRTSGMLLWFDGAPAEALFHADCGGHTSAASSVWGSVNRPYLVSRPDTGVPLDAHAAWSFVASIDDVARALKSDQRTASAGRPVAITVARRDDAGRAERVTIRGAQQIDVRGEDLRQALTRAFGARTIRSTWFDVRREGATFAFSGRGFGHGVGLCQAGTLARLRAGATLDEVLDQYYPGTRLVLAQGSRRSAH